MALNLAQCWFPILIVVSILAFLGENSLNPVLMHHRESYIDNGLSKRSMGKTTAALYPELTTELADSDRHQTSAWSKVGSTTTVPPTSTYTPRDGCSLLYVSEYFASSLCCILTEARISPSTRGAQHLIRCLPL